MKIDASCWPDVQLATDEMISFLKKVLQEAANLENVKASTEISLVFTDDAHIKEINRNYREKDQATDVLCPICWCKTICLFKNEKINRHDPIDLCFLRR